jgi:hypothetical protein
MSLTTGVRIHCRQWTLLPMPKEVIERVHNLAKHNSQGLDFRNDNEDSESDISSQEEDSYYKDNEKGMYLLEISLTFKSVSFRLLRISDRDTED